MANGVNHAKQIVVDEATQLANDLQNGHAGDPHTQGRAIGLLVKMITPMYTADFVTVEECRKQHAPKPANQIKLKAGPFGFEGDLTPSLMLCGVVFGCFGGLLFIIGKTQGWW
jgi:hypothetical protein